MEADVPRVLLLEDDAELREQVLLPGLAEQGLDVSGVGTASALYESLKTATPDIVVLDLHLPDADGFTVAQAVRGLLPQIGIIVLTGYGALDDQLRGFGQGADAYLIKPTRVELLAANIRSLARRLQNNPSPAPTSRWQFGMHRWGLVSPSGRTVALSRTEQRLVGRLAAMLGQLVSREQLIAAVTDDVHDYDPHRIESLIHRLRRKVVEQCGEALPLSVVHGKGYVLQDN
jgi:DNA-binding response OmpR family regulator